MHYSVLVILDGTKTVSELMAPYQENNMGTCPEEYLEFCSQQEYLKTEYNKNTETKINVNGTWISPYDDRFKKIVTEEEYNNYTGKYKRCVYHSSKPEYSIFDHEQYEVKDIPVSELYSFDEYATEEGYEKDDETGEYGYYTNPNSEWDWYQVGGRWGGLPPKPNKTGWNIPKKLTGPSLLSSPIPNGEYNIMKICDISHTYESRRQIYEKIWGVVMGEIELTDSKEDEEFAWYKGHDKQKYLDKFATKENYVNQQIGFGTYAVITPDGEWHNEYYDKDYHEKYFEKFFTPYENYCAILVDCHV